MKLLQFIQLSGTTIPKFARKIGYSPQHVYDVIKKKAKVNKKFLTIVELFTEGKVKEIDFIETDVLREDLEKSIQQFKEETEFHG